VAPPSSLSSGNTDSCSVYHPNDTKGSYPNDRSFYEFLHVYLLSGNTSLPVDALASYSANVSTHRPHHTAICDYTTKVRGVKALKTN